MSQGTRYSAIHASLAEALALVELKQSVFEFSRFGSEPKSFVHGTFAIAMDSDVDEVNQRRGTPRTVRGDVRIRLAHRLRADNQVGDRLDAHDQAEDACNAILQNADHYPGFHIWADGRTRTPAADSSYLFTELAFQVQFVHYTPED